MQNRSDFDYRDTGGSQPFAESQRTYRKYSSGPSDHNQSYGNRRQNHQRQYQPQESAQHQRQHYYNHGQQRPPQSASHHRQQYTDSHSNIEQQRRRQTYSDSGIQPRQLSSEDGQHRGSAWMGALGLQRGPPLTGAPPAGPGPSSDNNARPQRGQSDQKSTESRTYNNWQKLLEHAQTCVTPSRGTVVPVPRYVASLLHNLNEQIDAQFQRYHIPPKPEYQPKQINSKQSQTEADAADVVKKDNPSDANQARKEDGVDEQQHDAPKTSEAIDEPDAVTPPCTVPAELMANTADGDADAPAALSAVWSEMKQLIQQTDNLSGCDVADSAAKWVAQMQGRSAMHRGASVEDKLFNLTTRDADTFVPFEDYKPLASPSVVVQRLAMSCMRLMLPSNNSRTPSQSIFPAGWHWFQYCQDMGGLPSDRTLADFISEVVDATEATRGWPVPILVRNINFTKVIYSWTTAECDQPTDKRRRFKDRKPREKSGEDGDKSGKDGEKLVVGKKTVTLGEFDACVIDGRTGAVVAVCEVKNDFCDLISASRQRHRLLSNLKKYYQDQMAKAKKSSSSVPNESHAEPKKGKEIGYDVQFSFPSRSNRGGSRAAQSLGDDLRLLLCTITQPDRTTEMDAPKNIDDATSTDFYWKAADETPAATLMSVPAPWFDSEISPLSPRAMTLFCRQPTARWIFVTTADDVGPTGKRSALMSHYKHAVVFGLASQIAPFLFSFTMRNAKSKRLWTEVIARQKEYFEEYVAKKQEEKEKETQKKSELSGNKERRVEEANPNGEAEEGEEEPMDSAKATMPSSNAKQQEEEEVTTDIQLKFLNSVIDLWWNVADGMQLQSSVDMLIQKYCDRQWRMRDSQKELIRDPFFVGITKRVERIWQAEVKKGTPTPKALIDEFLQPNPSPGGSDSDATSLAMDTTLIVTRTLSSSGEGRDDDITLNDLHGMAARVGPSGVRQRLMELIGGTAPWFDQRNDPIAFYVDCLRRFLQKPDSERSAPCEHVGWRHILMLSVIREMCNYYRFSGPSSEAPRLGSALGEIRLFLEKHEIFMRDCFEKLVATKPEKRTSLKPKQRDVSGCAAEAVDKSCPLQPA